MSNQLLGQVYLRIMDDVIENCQTTFEEDGVNQQTLEDLRSTWQTKLSALKVGTFPWEPTPAPQPMLSNPNVPSNVPRPGQLASNGAPPPSMPVPSNGAAPVRVKTEPYEPQGLQNGLPPNYENVARQRAAQHLNQKFGAGANAQINQLQAQVAMNAPPGGHRGPPPNHPLGHQMTEQERAQAADFQRRQAQAYQNMQHAQQRPVANNAQTDGANDWDAYVAERRLAAAQDPEQSREADMTIRQHVEQLGRSMEGGGLMMPLSEQSQVPKGKKRKAVNPSVGPSSTHTSLVAAQSSNPQHLPKLPPQLDGADEDNEDEESKANIKDELFDEDDDEDAINSDLDDPDDNAIEEEQDEGRPNQIMLCTYDKVQRVKNKWKCTLRDGVLNTGGKEYVFTKATGEFEW